MSLYWYTCISMNTDLYMMYNILLETVWWVLSNTSLIVDIYLVILEIIANKTCSYWWSNILVTCCHFYTFYIYMNSSYSGLSSKTGFIRISLLVMKFITEICQNWKWWIWFLFYFLSFSFYFIFIERVQDKEDKVWHHYKSHDMVTEVTCSHDTEKGVEGSRTR